MNRSTVGFVDDIEQATLQNDDFRHVIHTATHMQLVLMVLRPGQEIGMEVHQGHDQFFRIEQGTAKVIMNGEESTLTNGHALIVPAGTQHNVINIGQDDLKLYTIYSPPNHPADRVQHDKPAIDTD